MRFEKFTDALKSALSEAQSIAIGRDNPGIDSVHLLAALLNNPANLSLCQQAGANPQQLKNTVDTALANQPKLGTPTGEVGLTPNATKVLNLADRQAQKVGDEFVATEWVLLALAEQGDTKKIFESAGASGAQLRTVIDNIREGNTVNSQNAEEQRGALDKYTVDLTARAEAGKLDPVIGRDEEIRRTIQVLSRRTKKQSCSYWRARSG